MSDTLGRARAVVRGASSTTTGDRMYRLYLAVLAFWIYVGPAVASGARSLAPGRAWAAFTSSGSLAALAAAVDLFLLVGLRVGPTAGPVRPPAGFVSFVLTSTVDRARALRGAWLAALLTCGGLALALGADVVASRALAGAWGPAWLLPVVAAAGAGVVGAGLWLRGQADPGRRGLVTAALGIALAAALAGCVLHGLPWHATMLLAGPGGWWALATSDPSSPWGLAAVALGVVAGVVALRVSPLLRGLRVHDLGAQAARLSGVAAGLTRGSTLAASEALGSSTSRGRALRLSASPGGPPIARRDLLGLRRTPETTAVGIALVAVGAALGSLVVAHRWPLLPAALAALLAALGTHLLSGGLRAHVSHANRDSWLGVPYRQAAVQHAWTPFAVGVCTWWVVALALTPLGALPSLVWGPAVLALLGCSSVGAAHQGDLPPGAVGTVTAEVGDTGAAMRVLWLVGVPLLGVGFGGGVLALAANPMTAAVVALVGLLVLAGIAGAALGRATAR